MFDVVLSDIDVFGVDATAKEITEMGRN